MTTTTPPGWYKEPGHTGNGPAMERWWDGSAWTEYTRTAPVPEGQPVQAVQGAPMGYPGYPGVPGQPGFPPGPGRRTSRAAVVWIVVAVLVVAGAITGFVLWDNGNSSSDAKSPSPHPTSSSSAPERGQGPGGGESPAPNDPQDPQAPQGDGSTAIDGFDGISLPVLSGWKGETSATGVGADVTIDQYPCPGDATKACVRGGVFAQPAQLVKLTATDPEAGAKADIAPNAADSYSTSIYGKTTSHQQLLSQAVKVAGQNGYLVRWKVATASGTSGYVESLVFTSPHNPKQLIVVRFGFDIGGKAPDVGLIDQITKGIKSVPVTSNGTSGGSDGSTGGAGV
ncbi:DUF2510 domain-containing protein [Streptomyces sp. CA-111067]|uniref:DUF2510 domain-containing protein n=1 Tax=Streptomyces sp. CA-111067 TaxID=3240046 RepID=UPI003D95FEAA